AANTPRASLSVGGNRRFAAIVMTGTTAQLCAAFSTGRATPPRAALFDRRSQDPTRPSGSWGPRLHTTAALSPAVPTPPCGPASG
ncbi:MAG: hypothetical protein EBS53_13355, partial [Bacteroidetes bacterium]|nr:hypothetical protein [Bacteroidota bacterium]